MPKVLITSIGGAGSNNLAETLRLIDADRIEGEEPYRIVGTHYDPLELAKGDADELVLVPPAKTESAYIEAHHRVIKESGVDVLIANSDTEVLVWSRHRDQIPCLNLVPPQDQVHMVQDKFEFHKLLDRHGCVTVPNIPIESRAELGAAIARLPKSDRFWIRLRIGSGSLAATWLRTAEQAEKWIDLWSELRGMNAQDFVLAPFLPGRDFAVAAVWQNGEFCVGKIYERLVYWDSVHSLSAMGSAPLSARTVDEVYPIEEANRAIVAVCDEFGLKPHGIYNCDLKCDEENQCYVTEINIGRFFQTSTHFDRVGKHRLLELYLSLLLRPEQTLPREVYDLDPGKLILRGADMPVRIVEESDIAKLEGSSP